MDNPAVLARFETEIARYNRWREDLTASVNAYHDWLEGNGQLDVQQSIRFYDLLENLNKGRLMLAFLAEFSRGKSELINALFFSSFKERLLPSDVGRTTMCPTEIFHDPNEEPYLKLLSVETRYRDESISQLKNTPVEWSKVRLNTNSATEMKKALSALADTKKVYALEARMLGLAPMMNEKGEMPGEEELVEVPAWRYAMINYPHPLLSNGLSILDTPGLNALGMEPELTVSTIPNAHAVLFLLSIDTGVTKSDLEIWNRYVRPGLPQKIAVLNKVDLMWDELKTPEEIERATLRMVESTSQALQLPKERIFALSAQKALLGKIREDAGLIRKSGIEALEKFLADEIVPMKRQILCKAVMNEIGAMMLSSRASVATKQQVNQASIVELNGLVGKSREVVTKLWSKITAEKNAYNSALAEYKVNHSNFSAKRSALMDMLNPAKLDVMLAQSAQAMEDSWTTIGLQRGMRQLSKLMSEDFESVFIASEDIKKLMQGVYNTFTEKFHFQKMEIPMLDFELHRAKLKLLVVDTDAFAKDPINVAHYKGPLVKKFYRTLVNQARAIFTDAKLQSERWLVQVTLPLETQIKDHKGQLQGRLDSLAKINEKSGGINEELGVLKKVEADLRSQRAMIDGLIGRVSQDEAKAATTTVVKNPLLAPQDEEQQVPIEFMKTTRLSTFEAARVAPRPAPQTLPPFVTPAAPAPPVVPAQAVAPAKPVAPAPAAPMISDDLMTSQMSTPAPASAPEGERTMKLPAFDPRLFNADGSKKADPPAAPKFEPEKTLAQPAPAFDPDKTLSGAEAAGMFDPERTLSGSGRGAKFDPERTQQLKGGAEITQKLGGDAETTQKLNGDAQTTQRLDDSIWKLQEAKRILKGVTQK